MSILLWAQNLGNTYNETMSGGVWANGSTTAQAIKRPPITSAGVWTSGNAAPTTRLNPQIASVGVWASGTAIINLAEVCDDIWCKLYAILSSSDELTAIAEDITPDVPTANTQLPVVIYNVTASEPTLTLAGQVRPTRYSVQIDTWAVNMSEIIAMMKAVKSVLNGYRDTGVRGSFLTDEHTNAEDEGYHGLQSFDVWF